MGVLGYISEPPRPGAHFCGAHTVVNGEGKVTAVLKKVSELRGIYLDTSVGILPSWGEQQTLKYDKC